MSIQPINLVFGVGRLYAKRAATGSGAADADSKWKLIGSIKGKVEFTYNPSFAEQRPSDTKVVVRRDLIEEKASLKASLVDFRIDQLRWILGSSLSTTTLSKTISVRLAQEFKMPASTTTCKTLSHTAKSKTSVTATTLDRATDYAASTDFTVVSTKSLKAKSAAFKGSNVRVYYTRVITPASGIGRLPMGDQLLTQQISLMYVHQQPNQKMIAIQIPIATIDGATKFAFDEKNYLVPEVSFSAIGDPNQLKGKKLFTIVREP